MSEKPVFKKQITFTEEAPHVYEIEAVNPSQDSAIWYSIADLEEFKALKETDDECIESKIANCSTKSSKAINILLDKKILKMEDFLGVEQSDLTFEDVNVKKKSGSVKWTKLKIKAVMMNGLTKKGSSNCDVGENKAETRSSTMRRPSVEDCKDTMKTDMESHGIKMELVEKIVKKLQVVSE